MNPRLALLDMTAVYGLSHYFAGFVYDVAFHGEAYGQHHVPRTGGFIVAANHVSHLDPPAIGTHLSRQLRFFARKTLWKPGFASWWLNAVGTIPVDRDGGSDVQAIKRILGTLNEGIGLIMFPEGTRSRDGRLQPARPGVGLAACRTGVPVIPTRIFGSFEAFGRSGRLRPGTPISVVFGPPLYPRDYDDPAAGKERYQRASERIMAAIAKLELPKPLVV